MRLPRATRLLLLVGVLAWAIPAQAQIPALQAEVEGIVGGTSGEWGVAAWSLDRDELLFAISPHRVLVPASTNKVFTSVWALDVLGPEHRFHTDLLGTGGIEGGVLRGDLYLRGSGDPTLGHATFHADPLAPLRSMARALRERGVGEIGGRIVGDASVFSGRVTGPDWPGDSGGGAAEYAPPPAGLAFQRNVIWIDLIPAGGGPPEVRLHPPVEVVPVVNRAGSSGRAAFAVRRADTDTIQVHGAVSGRGLHRYRVGVADPVAMTTDALRQALRESGIRTPDRISRGETPAEARLIHRHVSAPLAGMLVYVNRDSDNFFAEQIFRATAARAAGRGDPDAAGPAAALHLIRNAGVHEGELFPVDGSGLSSRNRASAAALLSTLRYAAGRPWFDDFRRTLAVAGAADGSMARMYRGTPAEGRMWAKTGYIRHTRALAGYTRTGEGERVAFVFLYNGPADGAARTAQLELGALLAGYRRGAPLPAERADTTPE